jgi:hypothetical protein
MKRKIMTPSRKKTLVLLFIITLTLAACNVGATPAPTVDINAINTAAVETAFAQIFAQQTMTALAAPSSTPLPTSTPLSQVTVALPTAAAASPTGNAGALPTVSFNTTPVAGITPVGGLPAPAGPNASTAVGCNNLTYIADVSIPDGTVFDGGEDFDKIWRVQNTGTCMWDDGYQLVYIGGDEELDPYDLEFKFRDFVAAGATAELEIELTAPLSFGRFTATWQMQADSGEFFGQELTVSIEVK